MRVAVISPIPVFPVTAGNRSRVLNLARGIRGLGHEVDFVYLQTRQSEGFDEARHVEEFGSANYHVVGRSAPGIWIYRAKRLAWVLRRKLAGLSGVESVYYSGLDELYSDSWTGSLYKLQNARNYDAVCVEYVFYSRALSVFPKSVVKILDTHDVFADRHKPFVTGPTKQDYMFSLPASRECAGFARADLVLAIQPEEARAIARRLEEKGATTAVASVSHLLQISDRVDCVRAANACFVGSNNVPNRDAVSYFIDRILPAIVVRFPSFRLYLAGDISTGVADHPNVVKLGRVKHLTDAFSDASISINPMRVGTGINIKLLESMALGVPIVTTQTGARGVDQRYTGGMAIVDEDEPEAFADAVIALVESEQRRVSAASAAYESALLWNETQLSVLRHALSPLPLPVASDVQYVPLVHQGAVE